VGGRGREVFVSDPSSSYPIQRLGPAEAAIFETFVVPRYLSSFGELALEMLADGHDAQVIHVDCRTGYPDRGLALRLAGAYIYGCDPSPMPSSSRAPRPRRCRT